MLAIGLVGSLFHHAVLEADPLPDHGRHDFARLVGQHLAPGARFVALGDVRDPIIGFFAGRTPVHVADRSEIPASGEVWLLARDDDPGFAAGGFREVASLPVHGDRSRLVLLHRRE
jgi:hypothetical protein